MCFLAMRTHSRICSLLLALRDAVSFTKIVWLSLEFLIDEKIYGAIKWFFDEAAIVSIGINVLSLGLCFRLIFIFIAPAKDGSSSSVSA